MQVTPSVRAVMVPEETPLRPDFTCIYLVGKGQVFTVDSGEAIDKFRWMLRGYLAAIERSEIALSGISHHHYDHSGNLTYINDLLGAEVVVPKPAVPLLKGRLPKGKGKVRTFADGEVIELDAGVRLRVIYTPGHSTDSVCYYLEDEGVLFTGDTMLGSTTTAIHDLGAYRRSLQTLTDLPNLKVICPGHGPIVHDPRERLQQYIDHRNGRERQILDVLAERKPVTSWEIMLRIYPADMDTRLRPLADSNVRTHLRQLEEESRIAVQPGRPRNPSAAKVRRQVEHARVVDLALKQARKYEAERARDALRRQENPATEEWIEPPRYELT